MGGGERGGGGEGRGEGEGDDNGVGGEGDNDGVGGGERREREERGGEGMEKGAQLSLADPLAQESVVTGSHNGGDPLAQESVVTGSHNGGGVDQPNTSQEFDTEGVGEGGEGDEEVEDQELDEESEVSEVSEVGGMGEEGRECELEKEMEARHIPPIATDQTAGVEGHMGSGRVDCRLVQQVGSDGGSSDDEQISEQLNRAEDNQASHLKAEEQPQFSQDLREDSARVSEDVGPSRGVPEQVQRWRNEQQSRLLEGKEPLPPPLFVGEQVGHQQKQETDREQQIEASKEGGGHSWDTYASTAAYHDELQNCDGGCDAGEVVEKEGQEWTTDQGVGATEPQDDGRGDVDEQRVEKERSQEREGGKEKAEEDGHNKWEKLDLRGFGQTSSFGSYFTLPIPSSTSPPPPCPVITESQSMVVTESPMVLVTESPSQYWDDDEDLDDDEEVRSLVTRSGKYAKVQDGSLRVVEEGRDPYYLQLKSTQDGFTADGIDDLMNDVIRLIGGGPQEPDPVDQDSADLGTHTHLPSSMPVLQSSPPTLEPVGSGHYRPPGDYLNLDSIRQRMCGEQQQLHHQQQHPPPQCMEYQARNDTMVAGLGQTGFSTTGSHPIPTVSVPPKVQITETTTDLPDFVDARDTQVEDSFSPPPLTPEPYIQEPPSEGGAPQVLVLEEEQEQEVVPPPAYGGGGEDQQKLEEDQPEKMEDQPEKMEDQLEKVEDQLEKVEDQLEKVEDQPEKVDDQPEKVEDQLEKVEDQLEKVEDQLEKVEDQLEKVEDQLEKMEDQPEKMDDQPEKMDDQLEKVEDQLEKVEDQLEKVEDQLEKMEDQPEKMDDQPEKMEDQLEKVEDQLEKVEDQLEKMEDQPEKMEDQPEKMDDQLEKVEDQLEKVEDQLEKVEDQLEKVEDQLEKVEDQLEKVEDQPEKMEDQPEKMEDQLEKMEDQLEKVEGKLEQQHEVEASVAVEEKEVRTSTGEEPEGELGGIVA